LARDQGFLKLDFGAPLVLHPGHFFDMAGFKYVDELLKIVPNTSTVLD
jgi:hypothetical protein